MNRVWFSRNEKRMITVCTVGAILLSGLNTLGMLSENNLWGDHLRYTVGFSFFIWGGILIFSIMMGLFFTLDWMKEQKVLPNRFECKLKGMNGKWICMVFILVWLPYCVMHYPTWIGGGAMNQIRMFYGDDTHARNMSNIIYDGYYYSNHHPVLLTIYYGSFWKLGDLIGNTNVGVFILSCCNLVICALCLSFMMNRIKKYMSARAYTLFFLWMCIYPFFGIYAFSCCKDNLYVAALAVFYSLLIDSAISNSEPTTKDKWFLPVISILIPFLKSQGVIIVAGSLLFTAIFEKKNRRIYMLSAVSSMIIYVVVFGHIMMPVLKISPVGRQEALSIPFQQTALLFKNHPESISDEDYNAVDAILPADKLADLYDENLADNVKFEFKQMATQEDLINYFKVWAKGLIKHPLIYVRAWSSLTDGYYYMGYDWTDIDLYHKLEVYNAHWPEWVSLFEQKEHVALDTIFGFPVLGQLFKCCIFSWLSIMTVLYILYSKHYKRLGLILGIELNFLVLLLCPGNAYMRYTLPLVWLFPIEYVIATKK